MKGFLFVIGLIGALFPLNAFQARRAAKRDPIDPESLKKASFPRASGNDWPSK